MSQPYGNDKTPLQSQAVSSVNKNGNNPVAQSPAANQPPSLRPVNQVPVAVFKDPYAKLRQQLIRIFLVGVAPVVGIILVITIIYFSFAGGVPGFQSVTDKETVTFGDFPLPVGTLLLNKAPDAVYSSAAEAMFSTVLPNYAASNTNTEIYLSKKSTDELTTYYTDKLVKGGKWQQYNKNKLLVNSFIIYFYVRPATIPKTFDGVRLQFEKLTQDIYTRRASLLNSKGEVGDTLIYLSRLTLTPR